jgi:two-component system chemotaxis sensor kinase CheA
MLNEPPQTDEPLSSEFAVDEAVLTEAIRNIDIVHTTLAGMTAIVVMLLAAVALPVFGLSPVTYPAAFAVMTLSAFVGIGRLYVLNVRVHNHVTDQACLTEVLVNSLGQGFMVFDRAGLGGSVYSQACLNLLETVPAGKNIADVLRVPEAQRADFQDWYGILFQADHALGFDDAVKFLPQYFPHSQQRCVTLVYRPIHRLGGQLANVVVIATDQTEEYEARQQAKRQQIFAEMICRIFKERNLFHTMLAHLREFLDATNSPSLGQREVTQLLRQLHTLKATVKQFNLLDLAQVIHEVEGDMRSPDITDKETLHSHLKEGRQKIADALLKVTDEVSGLIGGEHEWRGNVREIDEAELYAFAREMKNNQVNPSLIQRYLSTIAAVPIQDCFRPFERELKELASVMDKQVKPVRFLGSNPRVLTLPIQEFLFSLTHICRNIVDHGIEPAVTRMARGKDSAGQVTVSAEVVQSDYDAGKWLHLVISDDGNGIDPSRVRAKLALQDPGGTWRLEDDQAVIQRIFSWGFSTREDVTTISGRGVGLEAVEREVRLLGGTIRVMSEIYKGATFDIRIPYILDISQVVPPEPDRARASG